MDIDYAGIGSNYIFLFFGLLPLVVSVNTYISYSPSFVNYFGSPFKSYEPWDKNLIPNFLLSVQIQNFWWEPEEF